ncbi:MAG: hypothetical protein IEMM0008_0282 [bacterium]|nr:MAG: hypothetical protein IEMM0008_0282 [bacterium]
MKKSLVQYISNEEGKVLGVIVPIDLWHEIESEKETAYLLKSKKMEERLLDANSRNDGISLEDSCEKPGIGPLSI